MKELSHNQLQAAGFQWAHNTYPLIRGTLFAALNEIHPHPGESKAKFMQRLSQLKAIGLQAGVLDLIWIAPGYTSTWNDPGKPYIIPPATYAFDAKVGDDYLHNPQLKFIENLRRCGGDGWEFRTLEQFQSIFTPLYHKHYGT